MAKPRIFVSSTYYDLRHIRNNLENFIESLGYEAVLFESGDITFHHDTPIVDSCYEEVDKCHMLVLIIGGRYGSNGDVIVNDDATEDKASKKFEIFNSVTKKEYEKARFRNIPIFIFVDKNVKSEYETYKQNIANTSIIYAHVDNPSIFKLLDEILNQKNNNFVREFDKFADISTWLKDQWAGIFADFLTKKAVDAPIKDLASQVSELASVTDSLKNYTESIIKKLEPDNFEQIVRVQEKKQTRNKLTRFVKEPLIAYLLSTENLSRIKLYNAFEASNSVEEMLKIVGMDELARGEFLRLHFLAANSDYEDLKKRYSDRMNDDDIDILIDNPNPMEPE